MINTAFSATLKFNQPNQLTVLNPPNRSGFKVAQAGIIEQDSTDEFNKKANVPTVKLEQNGFLRTEIVLNDKEKRIEAGYITGTLPKWIELNAISGKDGPFIQLLIRKDATEPLKPLAGKSLIIPAGGSVKLGSTFEATLYKKHENQPADFSVKDYEPLQGYCQITDPDPYQAKTNEEDENTLTFWANLPIGGAGSRLFPLSSPDEVMAKLEKGKERYALPAGGKPAGWLPCDGKSMVGRALYYLALAGVTTVFAPIVTSSAPESIKQALKNAKETIKDKLKVELEIEQIKEERLGGQSSYLPDLWKDELSELKEEKLKKTYIINEFPDATYFPYPPYQEMMEKVQEAYNNKTPLDGLVLVKPVENVEELVKKYGETTYNKTTSELLGMHEKPQSVAQAKIFATEDMERYNQKHTDHPMKEADEGVGFRLGTEIYGSELLKVACKEQKDGYELLADRYENGNVKLVKNKPIYSMYNVFHAVGEGTVVKKKNKPKSLNVQVMELPETYQWADMGNYFGYLNTVRQLTYCKHGDVLRSEPRGVPYPIGGTLKIDEATGKIDREALYGEGVINLFDQLKLQTVGAVALVDPSHPDRLNEK
ncbi:MAG: hypothetical protein H2174_09355 [Vampirovibrio sp.]|nr:hypothetical protein [Vampirovibrio sp.]